MMSSINNLERELDTIDSARRRQAPQALVEKAKAGEVTFCEPGRFVNLHCHTFFSYNTYGYSPTRSAWLACKEGLSATGQKPTDDKGQMVRLVLESLALKYRSVLDAIEDVTGRTIDVLHIVGGGIQNELLCRFTANAIGRKVITGPIEATASGNVLMQARAAGQIGSTDEARRILRDSFELKEYQPQNVAEWERHSSTFIRQDRPHSP